MISFALPVSDSTDSCLVSNAGSTSRRQRAVPFVYNAIGINTPSGRFASKAGRGDVDESRPKKEPQSPDLPHVGRSECQRCRRCEATRSVFESLRCDQTSPVQYGFA